MSNWLIRSRSSQNDRNMSKKYFVTAHLCILWALRLLNGFPPILKGVCEVRRASELSHENELEISGVYAETRSRDSAGVLQRRAVGALLCERLQLRQRLRRSEKRDSRWTAGDGVSKLIFMKATQIFCIPSIAAIFFVTRKFKTSQNSTLPTKRILIRSRTHLISLSDRYLTPSPITPTHSANLRKIRH